MNMVKRMVMEMRGAKGLTQKQVAQLAGIDPMTLSRWVTGKSSPRNEQYHRFFEVYQKAMGDAPSPDIEAVRVGVGRDEAIAAMHRRGYRHAEIGELFGITRERVRQIVASQGEEPRSRGYE